jgi:hypothetical protein
MQRILTEEEYQELVSRGNSVVVEQEALVQKLCTMVAESKAIKYWGREVASIWGCIRNESTEQEGYYDLDEESQYTFDEKYEEEHPQAPYCDECPVRDLCPSRKSYSK